MKKLIKVVIFVSFFLSSACAIRPPKEEIGFFGAKPYSQWLTLSPQAMKIVSASDEATLNEIAKEELEIDAAYILIQKKLYPGTDVDKLDKIITAALIAKSDALCEHYMARFLEKSIKTTSSLGVGSLLFSTVGGLDIGEKTAKIYSSLSTFTKGTEDKLRMTVLGQQSPDIIYEAVMNVRDAKRTELISLLYSTDDALKANANSIVRAKLADYHNTCGPTIALNSIKDAVAEASKQTSKTGSDSAKVIINAIKGN